MASRSGGTAISLALLACACGFPAERGQRLEQRVDRIEADSATKQLDQDRAAIQEQARRIDANLAQVQAKLAELDTAAQQAGTERSARHDKLAEEVTRLHAALEAYGRRLDAIEKTLAQVRSGAGERVAERKGAVLPERLEKRESPEPAQESPDALAFAREQELKGEKTVARDLYRAYVEKFPTDPHAADAHFRLGELAFGERRYRDAILEYGKVAQDFPRSGKAPDALLRTAEAMLQLGLKDDASSILSEIPKRYPGTPAATRARERLAELKKPSAAAAKGRE